MSHFVKIMFVAVAVFSLTASSIMVTEAHAKSVVGIKKF